MSVTKPNMTIAWSIGGVKVRPADSKIINGWTSEKPPFQTENWIQNRTDEFIQHINVEGIPKWDNITIYENDSIVKGLDGKTYSSNKFNNSNVDPVDDLTGSWSLNVTRVTQLIDILYPINHILMTSNSANPASYLNHGIWEKYAEGQTVIGQKDGDFLFPTAGGTGGTRNANLPAHNHGGQTQDAGDHDHGIGDDIVISSLPFNSQIDPINGSSSPSGHKANESSSGPHSHQILVDGTTSEGSNLPPFIVTHLWKRIG